MMKNKWEILWFLVTGVAILVGVFYMNILLDVLWSPLYVVFGIKASLLKEGWIVSLFNFLSVMAFVMICVTAVNLNEDLNDFRRRMADLSKYSKHSIIIDFAIWDEPWVDYVFYMISGMLRLYGCSVIMSETQYHRVVRSRRGRRRIKILQTTALHVYCQGEDWEREYDFYSRQILNGSRCVFVTNRRERYETIGKLNVVSYQTVFGPSYGSDSIRRIVKFFTIVWAPISCCSDSIRNFIDSIYNSYCAEDLREENWREEKLIECLTLSSLMNCGCIDSRMWLDKRSDGFFLLLREICKFYGGKITLYDMQINEIFKDAYISDCNYDKNIAHERIKHFEEDGVLDIRSLEEGIQFESGLMGIDIVLHKFRNDSGGLFVSNDRDICYLACQYLSKYEIRNYNITYIGEIDFNENERWKVESVLNTLYEQNKNVK